MLHKKLIKAGIIASLPIILSSILSGTLIGTDYGLLDETEFKKHVKISSQEDARRIHLGLSQIEEKIGDKTYYSYPIKIFEGDNVPLAYSNISVFSEEKISDKDINKKTYDCKIQSVVIEQPYRIPTVNYTLGAKIFTKITTPINDWIKIGENSRLIMPYKAEVQGLDKAWENEKIGGILEGKYQETLYDNLYKTYKYNYYAIRNNAIKVFMYITGTLTLVLLFAFGFKYKNLFCVKE